MSAPDLPDFAPPTPEAMDSAIDQARMRCEQAGLRLTPQRAQVLRLLLERGGHAKAYELLTDLQATIPGVAPMTVYRALDFLTEHGLVHKVTANSSFVVCRHGMHRGGRPMLLLCDDCGAVVEHEDDKAIQPLLRGARGSGFVVQDIEMRGRCARCALAAPR